MNTSLKRAYNISKLAEKGKVLVVYGPRRSGKTTLVNEYAATFKGKQLIDTGDNVMVQNILSHGTYDEILARVEGLDLYIIDEAQNVNNIGLALKIIVDARPDLIIIATGSSSFDLANKIGQPLVGRRKVITLFPFSLYELKENYARNIIDDSLNKILTYGLYPQVWNAKTNFEKENILSELIEGYLLRDIFALEDIKSPDKLIHLIKLLAEYIGQPISTTKLASEIGLSQKTVDRYIDLLEKTFVIKKILPLSNKLSQSLKFKPKYYFYDIGIRNALLGDYSSPDKRVDIGGLWENFVFIERIKKNMYMEKSHPNYYFFRSYQSQKEVDIIEEYNGYKAFECKWNKNKKSIKFDEWDILYPNSKIKIISKTNYWDSLT